MDIVQSFYDQLAPQYDKLFLDWRSTVDEQALLLEKLFLENSFDRSARILDCACGIGTQTIGLAALGYPVTASDVSEGALAEAGARAAEAGVEISFARADFRALAEVFSTAFDIVIAMDNALPHMLSESSLESAVLSIAGQLTDGGLFIASIRDYDSLLTQKPPYSPPYIHKTGKGQRVSFQTWDWEGERYRLTQYIIDDEGTPQVSKFTCAYRAVRREELTRLLRENGFRDVTWKMPEETGFYQPIVLAKK